jgi:5-methylcytosine-specific restriction endonuclease McrA
MKTQSDYDRYRRDKNSKSFYNSVAWKKCRKTVLVRDNHLCQPCLQRGKLSPATTVHHKQHLRGNEGSALDVDNLISVCASCHNALHERHGADGSKR